MLIIISSKGWYFIVSFHKRGNDEEKLKKVPCSGRERKIELYNETQCNATD